MRLHDAPPPLRRPPPAPLPAPLRWRRWWQTLDAITPPLLVAALMLAARRSEGDPARVGALLIGGIALLAAGSGIAFFRDMSASHLVWPVMLGVVAVLLPLVALHAQFERAALGAPVPVHLLALAFTWTALFVTICTLDGLLLTAAAMTPQWAGVTVTPPALFVGWLPTLALRATPGALFTALLWVAAVSLVAVGVAWLLPERRRWFVIPGALAVGAVAMWPAYARTPAMLPGRWIFLVDLALMLFAAAIALTAPLLCRWLRGYVGAEQPPTAPNPAGTGNPARSCAR